jgi:hypothetical protein
MAAFLSLANAGYLVSIRIICCRVGMFLGVQDVRPTKSIALQNTSYYLCSQLTSVTGMIDRD